MFFFIKPSKLVVEAFVSEEDYLIAEQSPPFLSSPNNVGWFKKVPKSKFNFDDMSPHPTVKGCVGIINYLKSGIVFPLWSDLALKFGQDEWKYQFADLKSKISTHPSSQAPGFREECTIFKLESPWRFFCKDKNVKFLYNEPFYYNTTRFPFLIAPGLVESLNKSIPLNQFFFIPNSSSFELLIKKDTPILQVIPLSEKKIDLKVKVLDRKEYNSHFLSHHGRFSYRFLLSKFQNK